MIARFMCTIFTYSYLKQSNIILTLLLVQQIIRIINQINCLTFILNFIMICQAFILIFVIISPSHQACSAPNANGLIQTDSIIFRNQQSISRKHCYSLSIGQLQTPSQSSVAVSTKSISYQNFGLENVDYSIQAQTSVSSSNQLMMLRIGSKSKPATLLLPDETSGWAHLQSVSFLLQSDTFSLIDCQPRNSNQKTITADLQRFSTLKSNTIQSLVFISGLRTQSTVFTQQIQNSNFNTSTATLTVNIQSSGDLQFLRLDYILYDTQNKDFIVQFIQVSQSRSTQPNTYIFVGLTKFQKGFGFSLASRNQYSGFVFRLYSQLQCVGLLCQQRPKCETQDSCRANFGNIWNYKCIYCLQSEYYFNGQCFSLCTGNLVYNISQKKCVCINGHYRSGNSCIPIPNCSGNKTLLNNICQCQFGYVENNQGFCIQIPQCKQNQVYTNKQCVCVQGYGRNDINGICSLIPKCNAQQNWILDRQTLACICRNGFINISGSCIVFPNCAVNETLINNRCQCIPGYIRINRKCQLHVICQGPNQSWNSSINQCQCLNGYQRITAFNQYNCQKKVVCGQNYISINNRCVCPANFIQIGGQVCATRCGINEQFAQGRCKCISNYLRDSNNICRPCGQNQYISQNRCICQINYYRNSEKQQCKQIPRCPTRSSWNQANLTCECDYNFEYLIEGKCQPCSTNQGWNGSRCVCISGAFRIEGLGNQCYICNSNTFYNGKDCLCKPGYYGNRFNCQKCHQSCSNCTGPYQNQCIACADVSYSLQSNGICIRKTPCPVGLYLDGLGCKVCPTYCSSCSGLKICQQCINGFRLVSTETVGNACSQICGDGKRFEQECDDNNTISGDGCSGVCNVEQGWTCTGGTSNTKSYCSQINYVRSIINPKSAVLLLGRVVQGVRISYIPPALTAKNCQNCSKLLWIKVIKSDIVPSVSAEYISKSQYQFLVEFNFHGTISIPVFTFTVQINPSFTTYFSKQDMEQVQIIKVDSALLARFDGNDILTLQDIGTQDQRIKVPADAKQFALGK